MLTQQNIASNISAAAAVFKIGPKDNFLSVLPLHHTFETTAGFLAPLSLGASITYAESLKSYKIMEALQETKVTIMLGVPLLYQLFYEGIWREIDNAKKITKILFNLFFKISALAKKHLKISLGKLFFGKVHRTFGGHIHFLVTGGAAINSQIIEFFDVLGLPILQGYGLTESSPILCANPLHKNKFGSVGPALPGVTIKIRNPNAAGVGEIIAAGPGIMPGYYKNEEASAEILGEGWLYTGDLGYIDQDGYVFITGRLKDIIVSGSGVNIYPDEIEGYLLTSPFIKETAVVGTKIKEGIRKDMEEVHAAIFPNLEYFEKEFGKKNINPELIRHTLQQEIQKVNPNIAEYKRIASFSIKNQEFTKTSLKKIRRFLVRKEVEGMERMRV
jgi:long-chain acyl-CoA synthetase